MINNLPNIKVNNPKTVVRKAIFKPPAITPCDTLPAPSIASKACIRPITLPKIPQARINNEILLSNVIV